MTVNEIASKIDALSKKFDLLNLASKSILNTQEAAEYLSLSIGYLYQLTSQKKIAFYKTGKLNYFKKTDLDNYLLSSPQESIKEFEQDVYNNWNGGKV